MAASKSTTYELLVKIGAITSPSFKKKIKGWEKSLSGLNSTANTIMAGIGAGIAATAATATYAISNAVETYTEFEQEMATVRSISEATEAEFQSMRDAALDAGRSTVFTATEAASALEYMSLAGWDVSASVSGLTPVLELAAATGKELQTTSDLVTDSMSALGIGVDELDRYLDKLVASNNNANTTSEQLMEALVKTGGASRALGADLDDTVTALDILANNGKKGEDAGTALNAIFVRLIGNATALKELDKLGVNLWNEDGKFGGLKEGLEQINSATSGLTDEERARSLKNIAGTHYYSQMVYLLDAVESPDGDTDSAWETLESQVANSIGALDRMYKVTTDTLENSQKRLQSAIEDMQIRFVDVFSDDAKEFISWLAEELPNVTDSITEFAEAHRGEFADALESLGEGIEFLWENGIAAGQWIIKHKSAIKYALCAVASGIGLIKTAMFGLKIVEYLTNPLSLGVAVAGLAVTAIAAVAGVIYDTAEAIRDAQIAAAEANLASHFGNISLSLEELDNIARQIVGEDSLNGVATMLEAAAETASAIEEVTDTWNELQKGSWKINAEFSMTTNDYNAYGKNIEEYISSVEEYAATKGYEVHIAASLLFGEGSEQDLESSAFFASLEAEIKEQGDILYDYLYNETYGALRDGIIDVPEDEIVQEYLAKINHITSAIADAESQAKLDALTLKYNGSDLTPESMTQLQKDIAEYVQETADGAETAYESAMTEYYARLSLDDNYTQADFDADQAAAWEAYYTVQSEAAMNGINYMMNTLYSAYPQLKEGLGQYETDLAQILQDYMDPDIVSSDAWEATPYAVLMNMEEDAREALKNNLVAEDRDALSMYLEQMLPTISILGGIIQAYNTAGMEIPAEIQEFKETWQLIYDLVNADGDQASIDLFQVMADDDSFTSFLDQMGYEIDETHVTIAEKMQESAEESITPAIDGMYAYSNEYLGEVFSQGFSVEAPLDVTFKTQYNLAGGLYKNPDQSALNNGLDLYSNADGGIYYKPILTTFAEEGPEAAVPLDGSDRAKRLWVQSGQILGMLPDSTRDQELLNGVSRYANTDDTQKTIQVQYNPVITIQGSADKEDVQRALSLSLDELKDMIKEIQAENGRVAFAR